MKNEINFIALINEYSQPIFRYIYSHVHNVEITEDLIQQTFMKLWIQKDKLLFIEYIKPYIYKVALNEIRMYFRCNHETAILADGLEISDPTSLNDIEKENISLLLKELAKFSPLEREVITFRFILEMNTKETSIAIGKSLPATRITLYRVLQKLKSNIIKVKAGDNQ